MPWREVSIVDQRREFVRLAMQEGANRRELCRRFGIHPDTGYKWLGRWEADEGLADRSRRPHSSPARTDAAIEARILAVRDAHPAWGARKIARCLERDGHGLPALSTVHEILRRHGRIVRRRRSLRPRQRFEKPAPNLLGRWTSRAGWRWAWRPLPSADRARRSFALCLCLQACANEQSSTVQGRLERPSAATGCRRPSSSTTAPRGAILRAALDPAWRLAAQARRQRSAQPAVSSAEPRQERAVPPHA